MRSHPLIAAFGLLALVVTVALMAMLGMRILDDVSGGSTDEAVAATDGSNPSPDPTVGVPDAAAPGGSLAETAEAADALACSNERATIELAASAFEISNGAPATSVQQMVEGGWLEPEDAGFAFEYGPDGALVGTGRCTGT